MKHSASIQFEVLFSVNKDEPEKSANTNEMILALPYL